MPTISLNQIILFVRTPTLGLKEVVNPYHLRALVSKIFDPTLSLNVRVTESVTIIRLHIVFGWRLSNRPISLELLTPRLSNQGIWSQKSVAVRFASEELLLLDGGSKTLVNLSMWFDPQPNVMTTHKIGIQTHIQLNKSSLQRVEFQNGSINLQVYIQSCNWIQNPI